MSLSLLLGTIRLLEYPVIPLYFSLLSISMAAGAGGDVVFLRHRLLLGTVLVVAFHFSLSLLSLLLAYGVP